MAFFWFAALFLFALRVLIAYLAVPVAWVGPLGVLVSVVFVSLPIWAIFRASAHPWRPGPAVAIGLAGVAAHVGAALYTRSTGGLGHLTIWMSSLGQVGLMCWCLSLGTLLALLLKDKNLLLPVAAFLAGFDVYLVTAPVAPTRALIEGRTEIFQAVAMSVPQVATQAQATGVVRAMAYVGPADLFFLAMFFVALHRFQMRVRETARWIVPVLIAYLLVVLIFGRYSIGGVSLGALPALLPIGATVLLVNRREFKLTREEKVATWGVAVVAIALAAAGIILAGRASPADSSPAVSAPSGPGSAGSPGPTESGRSPSALPSAPADTPGPR